MLARRFNGVHVRLFPAQVQGPGAAEQVCRGLHYFGRGGWADVVILARGGGSLEDLWTFNEETVARAIAGSGVPVISAIGHETDFTIADFVADHRAPSPSAAAEIVIGTRQNLVEQIEANRRTVVQAMRYRLLSCSRDLGRRGADRALLLVQRALAKRAQRVDDLDRRLQASDLRVRFALFRNRQQLLQEQLLREIHATLWQAQKHYQSLDLKLNQLSPLTVLARGYAIVQNAAQQVIRSSSEVSPGEQLRVKLHEGELDAIVSGNLPA